MSDETEAPAWVRDFGPNPREMVAVANGLVQLPAYAANQPDAIRPNTPCYFNFNTLPYAVDRNAPEPVQWLGFLNSVWPDDPESVMLLQEWLGYLLTPDTRQQKILLMKGPPGAGKGTIGRLISALVGHKNCAAPNLHQFGESFGLSTLLGKSVAVIGEAKLSHKSDVSQITERLLAISGEDHLDVNLKGRPLVTTRLNTRLVIAANLPPALDDSAGALDRRWCPLVFTRSFKGQEDPNLFPRLLTELPGIFNWAVAGWSRLTAQGRFTRPEASEVLLNDMSEAANPVKEFIASCCRLDEGEQVLEQELSAAFRRWHQKNDADTKVKGNFRDLVEAACPEVKCKRIGPKTNRGPWYCIGLALLPNDSSDQCSYDTMRSLFPTDSIGE